MVLRWTLLELQVNWPARAELLPYLKTRAARLMSEWFEIDLPQYFVSSAGDNCFSGLQNQPHQQSFESVPGSEGLALA